jgi:hypothetical protein
MSALRAKRSAKAVAEVADIPEPKVWERAAIDKARKAYFKRTNRLEAKARDGEIGTPHSDKVGWCLQYLNAFGTTSYDFANVEMNRLISVVSSGAEPDMRRLNAALAVIDGIQPENEVEAMLAVQMAATHAMTMSMMAWSQNASMLPQMEAAGNLAVKLSRTFTAQVEALAKLRRKGEQKVTVEHVHVHAGGQAVVGNVTHTGKAGGETENARQAYADDARSLAFAPESPVWSEDPEREPMPVASGAR